MLYLHLIKMLVYPEKKHGNGNQSSFQYARHPVQASSFNAGLGVNFHHHLVTTKINIAGDLNETKCSLKRTQRTHFATKSNLGLRLAKEKLQCMKLYIKFGEPFEWDNEYHMLRTCTVVSNTRRNF